MFDAAGFITPLGIFVMAAVGMVAWIGMLYIPLRLAGIKIRDALDELSQPEAIFFGLYSIGAALVIAGLFPG